jgi:hypothetical protein
MMMVLFMMLVVLQIFQNLVVLCLLIHVCGVVWNYLATIGPSRITTIRAARQGHSLPLSRTHGPRLWRLGHGDCTVVCVMNRSEYITQRGGEIRRKFCGMKPSLRK